MRVQPINSSRHNQQPTDVPGIAHEAVATVRILGGLAITRDVVGYTTQIVPAVRECAVGHVVVDSNLAATTRPEVVVTSRDSECARCPSPVVWRQH